MGHGRGLPGGHGEKDGEGGPRQQGAHGGEGRRVPGQTGRASEFRRQEAETGDEGELQSFRARGRLGTGSWRDSTEKKKEKEQLKGNGKGSRHIDRVSDAEIDQSQGPRQGSPSALAPFGEGDEG